MPLIALRPSFEIRRAESTDNPERHLQEIAVSLTAILPRRFIKNDQAENDRPPTYRVAVLVQESFCSREQNRQDSTGAVLRRSFDPPFRLRILDRGRNIY